MTIPPFARIALLTAAALLASVSNVRAQRDLKTIPDPDPELERKSFQVAEGFEVNLYAADPLLAKPIQMNFDPSGRLWVASSEVYPQIEPGQQANDKVLVLEDKNGDGKADSTRVFADGLLIPTGAIPGDGGAYVANSTELVHFADKDGDLKADPGSKRVLLSGFGTEDTHHILHTFRWGVDGHLYFNQSIYIHSHIETPFGVRRLGGGGTWRFRPENSRLEVFYRGLCNPWGHQMDQWGQSFATDGAGFEGIHHIVPGFSYRFTPNAEKFMVGLNPGSPKHCGLEIVSGRHFPDDWQGNLITNDFRAHRVCRFAVSDDRSGFTARELPELIKTTHPAFRPIDVALGPDGAIYIADWYNPIIQHGEVDFRDPRRDHVHGRIWRVSAKNRPLAPRPKLVGASTPELLDQLKAPENWTRRMAQQVLRERKEGVLDALGGWVGRLDPNGADYGRHRLEALWLQQALDGVDAKLLSALLEDKDSRIRAAAVRVAGLLTDRLDDPSAMLAARANDENPRVRIETVRALESVPSFDSAKLALQALNHPRDPWMDYALWLTMRELKPHWLPSVQAGRASFDAHQLVFALKAVGSPDIAAPLRRSLAEGRIPADQLGSALDLIGSLGTPDDLAAVLEIAIAETTEPTRRAEVLRSLAEAMRNRQVKPSGNLERIKTLIVGDQEAVRVGAIRVAGLWKAGGLLGALELAAHGKDQPRAVRLAAIEAVSLLGEPGRPALMELSGDPKVELPIRTAAVVGLTRLDPMLAAALGSSVLMDMGAQDDPVPIFQAFAVRRDGATVLASALNGRRLNQDIARLSLRYLSSTGRTFPNLAEAVKEAGDLADLAPAPSGAERERFLSDVRRTGDPARGERIYRRKDLNCVGCHAIAGAGGMVGPSLESIGASAQVDYLADSLWTPNKAIKEGYNTLAVETIEGRVYTGIVARRTEQDLALRDAEGKEQVIPLSSVEVQKPAGSLMPEGLLGSLTRQEQVDLVRFLSELGKVNGPYAVGSRMMARSWQALAPDQAAYLRLNRESLSGIASGLDSALQWIPLSSKVSGAVSLDELSRLKIQERPWVVLRTRIEVVQPGPVRLIAEGDLNSARFWIDGREAAASAMASGVPLAEGVRTVVAAFPIDPAGPTRDPSLELRLIEGSPARARFRLGNKD